MNPNYDSCDSIAIKKAFNLSLKYLTYKARTENEVVNYLAGKEYSSTVISHVIEKLQEYKYLDDHKYSKIFIGDNIEKGSKGKSLIERELAQKGVSEEIITKTLSVFTEEKEIEIAKNIVKKLFHSKKSLPLNHIKSKAYNKLLQKGFSKVSIHKSLLLLEQDVEITTTVSQQTDIYKSQALALGKKYYDKYVKKEDHFFKLKQKIYSQLIRKGFDYQLAKNVVDEIMMDKKVESW
ncbi:RecX family transcriptional regulator [Natronincola ferrireducens]|uniref:Regulatory protein RecX n=1 Tax=Natronincola ferrireducens TaxID=393762 RepID=A0A1G9CFU8_9FIRM|nr:RecX family transcriptional regulator [Natronincola ferrireducens]SDK50528.1 regulatory protein [Natronincola ferrireducens]